MSRVFSRDLGMLILGAWLLITGLSQLVALGVPGMVTSVLAVMAGVLIIAGR